MAEGIAAVGCWRWNGMDSSRSNCWGYRILDFLDDEQMARLGDDDDEGAGQRMKMTSWPYLFVIQDTPLNLLLFIYLFFGFCFLVFFLVFCFFF